MSNKFHEQLVRYLDVDLVDVLTDEQREHINELCVSAMTSAKESALCEALTERIEQMDEKLTDTLETTKEQIKNNEPTDKDKNQFLLLATVTGSSLALITFLWMFG